MPFRVVLLPDRTPLGATQLSVDAARAEAVSELGKRGSGTFEIERFTDGAWVATGEKVGGFA
jgi:hypothetical protein